MIISLSGAIGSGKSTIAKMLAQKLGWPRYYIGSLRRQIAKERGLTLTEYNKLGETDPTTDSEVDEYQKRLGKTLDNFIIEGRTSWYFIPHSLKIFLEVDEKEGAQRVFTDLKKNKERNEDKNLKTLEDVLESNQRRLASDKIRYKKYYNVDVFNHKNYDFVLDTTNLSIEEVFTQVYDFVAQNLAK
ncbi:MAG: cytidylate kinase family protein [Candidatus Falkowbacteria bacterium]|nr:cytidylate kinase family protein [Candidatus Falkowbacteria bacterium]